MFDGGGSLFSLECLAGEGGAMIVLVVLHRGKLCWYTYMNPVDHVCGVRDNLKTFARLFGGVVRLNPPCSHLSIGPFL